MQCLGDAEKRLVDACISLFPSHVPQGDDLSGRLIVLIIEYSTIDNNIQQQSVFGQTFGLKPVKDFLFKQSLDTGTGFRS